MISDSKSSINTPLPGNFAMGLTFDLKMYSFHLCPQLHLSGIFGEIQFPELRTSVNKDVCLQNVIF